MSTKRTMPFEPEELPITPRKPEIAQPHDPSIPDIPEEAPDRFPQELPPDPMPQPNVEPGAPDQPDQG